jgi:hypothetical protein
MHILAGAGKNLLGYRGHGNFSPAGCILDGLCPFGGAEMDECAQ